PFGVLADAFVLFADGTGAFGAGFRDEAGDLAGARRSGLERLVQQAGESCQALLEILGADIEGGDQGIELDAPLVDAVISALIAVIDDLDRLNKVAAENVELPRRLPKIADDLSGNVAEVTHGRLGAPRGVAGRSRDLVHRGDEFGHTHHERIFQRTHVFVSAAEYFLEHDVGFAQALEESGRVGPQHCVRLEHFLYGRRRCVLRLRDRFLRGLVELVDRARDHAGRRFARSVDDAGNFAAVVHHRAREGEALFLDRLYRLICGRCDVARELRALLGDRCEHTAALFREHGGHFVGTTADSCGDLLGLADEAARDFLTDTDQSALGISRAGADRLGGGQRELPKRALGFRRVDLDYLAELLQPRIERIGGRLATGLDLAGDRFRPPNQQVREAADSAVEIVCDFERPGAERLVDLADLGAD